MRIAGPLGAQLRNMNNAWMCPIPLEKALARDPALVGHVLRRRRLDALRRQGRPPRRQREAAVQRARAGVLPLGPARRRVPAPRARRGLGRAQPASQRERRVRAAHRRRHRARATRTSSAARRWRSSPTPIRARFERVRLRHRRRSRLADDFLANLQASIDRFNELAQRRRRRGLRPRRARRAAALQRRREGRAGPHEPDDVADRGGGALLRGAGDRRHAGHQGRPEDDLRRPGPRRHGPPDPGPLRRRQLRRLAVGPRLLGGRRDARADHRLRLPRGPRGARRAASGQRRWPAHNERRPHGSQPRRP